MLTSMSTFTSEPNALSVMHRAAGAAFRPAPAPAAQMRGADSLRLATRSRLEALEAGSFWQALLHPELKLEDYASLMQMLSSVWLPISRALRERAEGLGRADWLPNAGTARLQADLACLRRHGVMVPSRAQRPVDLPRGDAAHLVGMVTMVRLLQMQGARVARHVDEHLNLGGEGRRFFRDPSDSEEHLRGTWAEWRRHLDHELRLRESCESGIRGACGFIDLLQHRLNEAMLMA